MSYTLFLERLINGLASLDGFLEDSTLDLKCLSKSESSMIVEFTEKELLAAWIPAARCLLPLDCRYLLVVFEVYKS